MTYYSIPSPQEVSIVIAGRNSQQYLDAAITSALEQSISCEVIYVDDCSTDGSIKTASTYLSSGLRLITNSVHKGVCSVRNQGLLASRGQYVIFMDSDDILPFHYVKVMLDDLRANPDAPFIYPCVHAFGQFDKIWFNVPWDKHDLWSHNQVSTTSLWKRSVLFAAGLWDGSLPTMWDYDLAIRCSRFGTPVAGRAILEYRIHNNSVSALLNERLAGMATPYKEIIRRKNATVGIGSIVSGRLPELFPLWLDKLSLSVRYAGFNHKPKLVIGLHDEARNHLALYQSVVGNYSDTFNSIQLCFINSPINRDTIVDDLSRRVFVSNLLASACSTLQGFLGTDITWLIEDDIVVPINAYKELFYAITAGSDPPIGVSGSYYNRHTRTQLVGGWLNENRRIEPSIHFGPEDTVDFVGTGCLMFWSNRPGTPKAWRPITTLESTTAHDWAWSEDVKGTIKILGSVLCSHHISLKTSV